MTDGKFVGWSTKHIYTCFRCGRRVGRIVAPYYIYPEEGYTEQECAEHRQMVDESIENREYKRRNVLCDRCLREGGLE